MAENPELGCCPIQPYILLCTFLAAGGLCALPASLLGLFGGLCAGAETSFAPPRVVTADRLAQTPTRQSSRYTTFPISFPQICRGRFQKARTGRQRRFRVIGWI
jgi:hypothetical protein